MTESAIKRSLEYFGSEYNCAQAVLTSILEEKGLMFDEAVHVAAGLGGGICGLGLTCGAVSGAVLAIGVLNGQKVSNKGKDRGETYKLSREFIDRFREEFGTEVCSGLIGYDITDPVQRKKAQDEEVFKQVCPPAVEGAARILLEMFPS
jgi:C_GCAxxG_C_C family probable redox protein